MSVVLPSPSKSPLSYKAIRQGQQDFPSVNLHVSSFTYLEVVPKIVLHHLPRDQGQADQPLVPQIFSLLEYRSAIRKQCCRNKTPFFNEQFICSSSIFLWKRMKTSGWNRSSQLSWRHNSITTVLHTRDFHCTVWWDGGKRQSWKQPHN